MSNFINYEDYDASIHRDILDALILQDEAIIEIIEDRTITDMRGYLATRYDVDALFSAQGTQRNQLVLMMALDMAIYHIFCIHNPVKLSAMRKDRYDRAVDWMKAVGRGKINIDGAPLLPLEQQTGNSPFLSKYNPKRTNHY